MLKDLRKAYALGAEYKKLERDIRLAFHELEVGECIYEKVQGILDEHKERVNVGAPETRSAKLAYLIGFNVTGSQLGKID